MRFLVDEQLPPALARWLVAEGHEAEHVYDLGLTGLSDTQVTQRALKTGAVVVTKDEDYLSLRLRFGPVQVLWMRVGNVSNRCLFARLAQVWSGASERLQDGDGVVEVR